MPQVFLSYSRRDLGFVEKLASDLKEAGLDVWYDLSGLDGGSRWRRAIEKAIQESQYVIMVLSPDSVNSEWVEREYLYASKLGREIIPILYRPCDLPMYYLDIHFIDVEGDKYEKNFPLILRVLNNERVEDSASKTPVQLQRTQQGKSVFKARSILLLLFASLGLIAVMLFGASYLFGKNSQEPTGIPVEIMDTSTSAPPTLPSITSTATKVKTPTLTPFPTEIVDAKGVKMVFVPEGSFLMGNKNGDRDERDEHTVTLSAYYIDKYEVTNGLYKLCEDALKCDKHTKVYDYYDPGNYYINPKYDEYPVIFVNWEMANQFCEWRGARLPTEAEWEKAAKGNTNYSYPWGNNVDCEYANYYQSGKSCVIYPTQVGSYELGKSPYGAYDMAGNVWEWTADWYDPFYYQTSVEIDPTGPSTDRLGGSYKVIRGGSWLTPNDGLRSSNRSYAGDFGRENDIGFRCAKDVTP